MRSEVARHVRRARMRGACSETRHSSPPILYVHILDWSRIRTCPARPTHDVRPPTGQSRAIRVGKGYMARGTPPRRPTLPPHGASLRTTCPGMVEVGPVSGERIARAAVGARARQPSHAHAGRVIGGKGTNEAGTGARVRARGAAYPSRFVRHERHRSLARRLDASSTLPNDCCSQECSFLRTEEHAAHGMSGMSKRVRLSREGRGRLKSMSGPRTASGMHGRTPFTNHICRDLLPAEQCHPDRKAVDSQCQEGRRAWTGTCRRCS